jgi:hypothetical protein
MMKSLQSEIISQYKVKYPKHTLKEISKATGIQNTRVFRIMNGSEMKLSEYESLKECINKKRNLSKFESLVNDCKSTLTDLKMKNLCYELESLIKMQKMTHPFETQDLMIC